MIISDENIWRLSPLQFHFQFEFGYELKTVFCSSWIAKESVAIQRGCGKDVIKIERTSWTLHLKTESKYLFCQYRVGKYLGNICIFQTWNSQWILTFEIYKYFPNIFITWIKAKIIVFIFLGLWSTGPLNLIHMLSAACLNCNWFFGNSIAAEDCFQLVPKYRLKVKLQRRQPPNIFIWNKSCSRKWVPRSSFWKIHNFQIPKGLYA